jgi:hypothetical protein
MGCCRAARLAVIAVMLSLSLSGCGQPEVLDRPLAAPSMPPHERPPLPAYLSPEPADGDASTRR